MGRPAHEPDEKERRLRPGHGEHAVRHEEPEHVQLTCFVRRVVHDEAHRLPPAHRDDRGALHDRRDHAACTSSAGVPRLLDGRREGHRRAEIVEAYRGHPDEIGNGMNAVLGERLYEVLEVTFK